MKDAAKRKPYKQIALILSLAALVLWTILGTGTSIAWFSDTSPEIKNVFHFADFKLDVSHRLADGTWEEIDAATKVFDDEALYEPGYVQVVYLRVENNGTVPFDFQAAVTVSDYTPAINLFGRFFNLQDYLKFGVASAATEAELESLISKREQAVAIADLRLNNYSTDTAYLAAGDTVYMALIVRMPEDVGNAANYRGDVIPRVELGVIVNAAQITT